MVEELDDDVCLYRTDVNEVLVLNQSAGDVWRLADGELTVTEIVNRLARSYGLGADAIAPDVRNVVEDLVQRGYLIIR